MNFPILIFSGSDGHDTDRIHELKEQYVFSKCIWMYQPSADRWTPAGDLPVGVVTTNVVWMDEKLLIAGGESGPGRRTHTVLVATPSGGSK